MKVWQLLNTTLFDMGKMTSGTDTSGASTTVITNSNLALGTNTLKDGVAFVVDTTDNAAPKGEFQRIASNTATAITVDTAFSATLTTGDTYGFIDDEIPITDLYIAINMALELIGTIGILDTSITIAANQTEYAFPLVIKEGELRAV